MEERIDFTKLGWRILFGEDYESIPDPNLPENTAVINAKQQGRRDELLKFVEGAGKPLYERWSDKIKRDTLALIVSPLSQDCNCMNCLQIKKIQYLFELLLEAQEVIERKNK